MQLLSVQSSSFVWQFIPEKPSGQRHVYELTYWLQVAPFRHGSKEKKVIKIDSKLGKFHHFYQLTLTRSAFIDINFTVFAFETIQAQTCKVANSIQTSTAIRTWE